MEKRQRKSCQILANDFEEFWTPNTKESLKLRWKQSANNSDPKSSAWCLISCPSRIFGFGKKCLLLPEGNFTKQYCPMAKNNESAFWPLVRLIKYENPYFGD